MSETQDKQAAHDQRLLEWASIMGITTLEVRNWDRLDFREVYVGSAKRALQAAYEDGLAERGRPKSAGFRYEVRQILNDLLDWDAGYSEALCWKRARKFRDSLFPKD